ncbi:MAG: thiosulfate oxidation carrier protein SoxY [Beijerinckiaceae bacterium]
MNSGSSRALSRRAAIASAAAAAFAAVLSPRLALASPETVEAEIKKLYGDKKAAEGKIKIDAPQIAENGLVVPITVDVESPMTDASHVKALHIFADGNPLPGVATFRFTAQSGRASASTRMRLAQTQNIVCIAEMSDGALHVAKAEVKVTIGGCGG